MTVRLMTIDDYDEIYALWLSCKGMGLNDTDDTREGIERFLKRNPDTNFVAEEDGRIVGVIMAGNDGRRGYIYHTAVREECRGRGIATELVKAVLESFKQIGISKTALVVFGRNEAGNAFWEKMGFTLRTDINYRNLALTEIVRMDT
ncbi:MAG: GNAT family N-acetyltransferase [Solobacterium sp.]|nr:GNAT family N-acetyltransferase [Solobacterium sp.]